MHPQMARLYKAAQELQNISTQAGVARALDTSSQVVHNWEMRGMSKQGMLAAQRVFGCSASWLEAGDVPMSIPSNVGPAAIGTHRIPLIDYVQAGLWTGIGDPFPPGQAEAWITTDGDLSPHAFALEIRGDSMLPEFRPGDVVIIDPDVSPRPGEFVVAKNDEEEATFKKYRPRGMNAHGEMVFELVPLNDDYPSMRSDITPIRIIGTLIQLRKNYRRR